MTITSTPMGASASRTGNEHTGSLTAPHAVVDFLLLQTSMVALLFQGDSLRALAHLAALLLEAAGPLLLPLPPEHGAGLLVRVGLVRHRCEAGPPRIEPAPSRWLAPM